MGEASGENAWKMIMETGGYDKDRTRGRVRGHCSTRRSSTWTRRRSTACRTPRSCRFPGGSTWDAVKGELWEVTPIRQKLASYIDMAAMLATGSTTRRRDGRTRLGRRGAARRPRGQGPGGQDRRHRGERRRRAPSACLDRGALGVISHQGDAPAASTRCRWAGRSVGGRHAPTTPAKFAFQIPPRDGDFLKRRLLAGQKITVQAQVVPRPARTRCRTSSGRIPGTDPAAGEVIFSAHLFEGYVKQGGNDNISGCAALRRDRRARSTR